MVSGPLQYMHIPVLVQSSLLALVFLKLKFCELEYLTTGLIISTMILGLLTSITDPGIIDVHDFSTTYEEFLEFDPKEI